MKPSPLLITLICMGIWWACGLAGAFLTLTLPQDVFKKYPRALTIQDVLACLWFGPLTLILVVYLWVEFLLSYPVTCLAAWIVKLGQKKLGRKE